MNNESGHKMANIMESSLGFSKKNDGRPKVYFTYQQTGEKSPSMTNSLRNQHIYTEPASLNLMKPTKMYYKEVTKTGPSQNYQNTPHDPYKKIGNYELQGNPRIYRNYVQQKIKYI